MKYLIVGSIQACVLEGYLYSPVGVLINEVAVELEGVIADFLVPGGAESPFVFRLFLRLSWTRRQKQNTNRKKSQGHDSYDLHPFSSFHCTPPFYFVDG
jgi:hypothetical protein